MSAEVPYAVPGGVLVASAEVNAAGALQGNSFGVTAAPVVASSVYTYTLANPVDVTNCVVAVTITGTTAFYHSGGVSSDTTIAIATFNVGGTPTDAPHQVHVWRTNTR